MVLWITLVGCGKRYGLYVTVAAAFIVDADVMSPLEHMCLVCATARCDIYVAVRPPNEHAGRVYSPRPH